MERVAYAELHAGTIVENRKLVTTLEFAFHAEVLVEEYACLRHICYLKIDVIDSHVIPVVRLYGQDPTQINQCQPNNITSHPMSFRRRRVRLQEC